MTLTLELRTQPPGRVSATALTPDALDGMDAAEAAALTVRCGRQTIAVGDLFAASGFGDSELVLSGDLRLFDGIGARMSFGRVTIDGACGDDVGARMRGGEIVVRGDAGDWAGAELAGGRNRAANA